MRAGTLATFQQAIARALLDPASPDGQYDVVTKQRGFAVYRNTVLSGCIDALQANYPAVTRLVGIEWFRAAAAVYVRTEPPTEPMLAQYGAGFAAFLATFEPAAGLRYLPDVARLDRCWTEAHCAATIDVLAPSTLAQCTPQTLAEMLLTPHPAARWAWFAEAPIYTLWSRNREEQPEIDDFEWRGEGALITRPDGAVQWTSLDAAGCAFLDACADGAPLAFAAEAALRARPDADLAHLMSTLLEMGAFRVAQGELPTV